jgi:hypothetical protein
MKNPTNLFKGIVILSCLFVSNIFALKESGYLRSKSAPIHKVRFNQRIYVEIAQVKRNGHRYYLVDADSPDWI